MGGEKGVGAVGRMGRETGGGPEYWVNDGRAVGGRSELNQTKAV